MTEKVLYADIDGFNQDGAILLIGGMEVILTKTSEKTLDLKITSQEGGQQVVIVPSDDKKGLKVSLNKSRPKFEVIK